MFKAIHDILNSHSQTQTKVTFILFVNSSSCYFDKYTSKMSSSSINANGRHQAILDFWFGAQNSAEYGKEQSHWFSGMVTNNEELDTQIKVKFEQDYLAAKNNELDSTWKSNPYSTLALILLLDQIPRNIYRGKPEMHDTDLKALSIAKFALEQGYHKNLRLKSERLFMTLPFLHAEDLEAQAQASKLYLELEEPDYVKYSEKYYKIIEKFGRFPHRNEILGRESTKEELEFLEMEKTKK